MYFDIFALVSAKRNTFAINCQTVVVTSLKMASLDHYKLTRVPQIDISDLSNHRLELIELLRLENPQMAAIFSPDTKKSTNL